jgi:prolyl-tRNA editing enzyme YbaK/EbsC (Cys-tRNA(Pro) deacylase)
MLAAVGFPDATNQGDQGGMSMELSSSARKVQCVLEAAGLSLKVVELPASTRTVVEAAQAVGCEIGQIVKSLVFKTRRSERPVLIIASGANRVDERKIGARLGEELVKADADFVRHHTGFAIGGVPPVGHLQKIETFLDEDLLQYREIWAAAGTPNAVFQIQPAELLRITGAKMEKVAMER